MRVGVLGAGQLGRMLALAGIPYGVEFVFYDRNPHACAAGLGRFICGEFNNKSKLAAFAGQVDVVTVEFENIPLPALETVSNIVPLRPNPYSLRVTQDRISEKQLFVRLGIPTPAFHAINEFEHLESAAQECDGPLILKSRRFGYDGKGQARLSNYADAQRVWQTLGGVPLIAEEYIAFDREVSIIAARSPRGDIHFYPLTENIHHQGILIRSQPLGHDPLQGIAEDYARRVMEKLDYTGVLAIEFFDCAGSLVANEIAPRVHNTGHWTIEGAVTSQFENHVRAILDWPLGDTALRVPTVMYNLIGSIPERQQILGLAGAHLHDYGKQAVAGRKLGHITLCNPDSEIVQRLEQILAGPAYQHARVGTQS